MFKPVLVSGRPMIIGPILRFLVGLGAILSVVFSLGLALIPIGIVYLLHGRSGSARLPTLIDQTIGPKVQAAVQLSAERSGWSERRDCLLRRFTQRVGRPL